MADRHQREIDDVTRGWSHAGSLRAELKNLLGCLEDEERLVNVARARCTGRTGLLAVTDRRMLFLRVRLLKRELELYPFDELLTVRMEQQLLGGSRLHLDLATGPVEFRDLERERAQRILDHVQSRLRGDVVVPVAGPADVEALKRELGLINRGRLATAYWRLRDLLQAAEQPGPGSYATQDGSPGLLLATDRRLLFVPANPTKRPAEWQYREIRAIELDGPKTVGVAAGGRRAVLADLDDGRGEPLVTYVRAAVPRFRPDEPVESILRTPPRRSDEQASTDGEPGLSHEPATNAEPIDVNAAGAEELTTLGLDRPTAEQAVALRDEGRRFESPDDFADALKLSPHLRQRVRAKATARAPEPPDHGFHDHGDVEILPRSPDS